MSIVVLIGLVGTGLTVCIRGQSSSPGPPSAMEMARFEALLRDGVRLLEEGNVPTSREAVEEALRIDPDSPVAIRLLAATYRKGLNFDKAMEILDAAIDDHPDDLDLRMERAQVQESRGDHKAARDEYERIVKKRPDDEAAFLRLALAEFNLNRFEEARKAARHALELGREDPECHYIVGAASESMGDDETAEREYRRALAAQPGRLDARYRLGHLLVRTGRREEGQVELKRGSRIGSSVFSQKLHGPFCFLGGAVDGESQQRTLPERKLTR